MARNGFTSQAGSSQFVNHKDLMSGGRGSEFCDPRSERHRVCGYRWDARGLGLA